jgi:hypothetical protein
MIQVQSEKKVVTYQSVSVEKNYDINQNQKVVNIYGKEWYAQIAYISENWDVAEGAPSIVSAKVNFVSILKNGKAGNNYKTEKWVGKDSYNGAFKELFEAYEQELAKVTQEVAVA